MEDFIQRRREALARYEREYEMQKLNNDIYIGVGDDEAEDEIDAN